MSVDKPAALADRWVAVDTAIKRIVMSLVDTPCGVGCYALLAVAVVSWRKTGLSIEDLHDTIDRLAKSTGQVCDN